MGTQSILLFEEKAFWSLQGNTFLWLSVRKLTPFPSITAENQTLRSKKQGEQRFNYAFYTFTHSNSKPKIFRTSYSADTNVLEQENAWERWPKNGLTGTRTQGQGNRMALSCTFVVFRRLPPFLGDIWVMGSQKICKTRFRTVTDRLGWW